MGLAEDTLLGILESKYQDVRANAAEKLHNVIVDAINEQQPSIETVLYVLEMVKYSVVANQKKAVAPAPAEDANATPPASLGWRSKRDSKEEAAEKKG